MPPPPFPRKISRSLVVLSFFFPPLSLALAWFGLCFELLIRWFRPIIEQLCTQLNSAPGGKKKETTLSLRLVHTDHICCRLLLFLFFWYLRRSPSCWIEFDLFFFCYRDISRLATKCGYWDDIFQPVYMKSAEPLRHVFTCPVAPETRGLKLVHAFFFGLFSMLRKLQYTRMFVYISGTGLCRPLGDNNLSVLPFSTFQQLTSLTQL